MALGRQVDKEPSQFWAVVSAGSIVTAVEAFVAYDGVVTTLLAAAIFSASTHHLMDWAKYHFGKER